jgi:Cu(I)/Ag(I) efflux system membrane fusion protein
MAQNLGIRTAPVERRAISTQTRTVGVVSIDETRLHAIEARASGWVEELDVRAVGDPVRRGQRVAGIYSPELHAAQAELILAARSSDATLKKAARERLLLLGLPEAQVDHVLATGQPQRRASVVATVDGVVTGLNVREGQQTSPGMPLMRIANLSRVWVVVEVPEAQMAGLRAGQEAEARLRALPGRTFQGEVAHVYPELQAGTRTGRARVVLDNPDGELKPGMFAEVTLGESSSAGPEATVIPTEALIRTGTRNVVILAEAAGRFRPVNVEPGAETGDETVILSGLEPGQQVVVSGQFLLDSEASLRGAFDRLEGEPSAQEPDR